MEARQEARQKQAKLLREEYHDLLAHLSSLEAGERDVPLKQRRERVAEACSLLKEMAARTAAMPAEVRNTGYFDDLPDHIEKWQAKRREYLWEDAMEEKAEAVRELQELLAEDMREMVAPSDHKGAPSDTESAPQQEVESAPMSTTVAQEVTHDPSNDFEAGQSHSEQIALLTSLLDQKDAEVAVLSREMVSLKAKHRGIVKAAAEEAVKAFKASDEMAEMLKASYEAGRAAEAEAEAAERHEWAKKRREADAEYMELAVQRRYAVEEREKRLAERERKVEKLLEYFAKHQDFAAMYSRALEEIAL